MVLIGAVSFNRRSFVVGTVSPWPYPENITVLDNSSGAFGRHLTTRHLQVQDLVVHTECPRIFEVGLVR